MLRDQRQLYHASLMVRGMYIYYTDRVHDGCPELEGQLTGKEVGGPLSSHLDTSCYPQPVDRGQRLMD